MAARLKSRGDWDVAIFGAKGRLVAGSASYGGNELAEGFVRRGERLTIQACRFRGSAASARVSINFTRLAKRQQGKVQVVDVATPTRASKERLQTLGLDLTEHGGAKSLEVVLHGRADARTLRRAGFRYTVRIADLAARTHRNRQRDARHARATAVSGLPSGRDSYRRLPDYDLEMKRLAMQYPSLVRPITLKHKSLLGRDVNGIEITTNAQNTADGKPIFLNMGVHHAREWPSSEHALEFAYDLLRNYGSDSARHAARPDDAHDRGADREPGRVQHLARGGPARRLLAVRLRDEAQELPHLADHPEEVHAAAAATTTRPGACAAPTRTATTAGSGAAAARA